jgi:hypothetical protein
LTDSEGAPDGSADVYKYGRRLNVFEISRQNEESWDRWDCVSGHRGVKYAFSIVAVLSYGDVAAGSATEPSMIGHQQIAPKGQL